MRLDLTGYTQVRLIASVVVAGFADYSGKDLGGHYCHRYSLAFELTRQGACWGPRVR